MTPSAEAPVLVIGLQGQVASALQRLAPALLPQRPLVMASRPELDLAAPDFAERLAALLRDLQPALVINAAAYTAVDRAESEPELAMAVNGYAVGAMARACAERAIPLFHLSTDYVFDGSGEQPWAPGDITAPLGLYGASKLLGEQLLQQAVREQGLRALVLRVSWVFGQQGANFVRTMLRLAGERNELKVVADQVGGPTSAESIARALLQLVEPALANIHPLRGDGTPFPWGIHHLQGQPATSWHGFAAEIMRQAVELQLLERAPVVTPISTAAFPTTAQRPANSRLDCSSAELELGLALPAWREDLRAFLLAAAQAPVHP
jgi:dTDP-4-dehydrorhamnose reductase